MDNETYNTEEWDRYRRQMARAWLHYTRSCVAKMRSLEDELIAESDHYDMLKAVRYDKIGDSVLPLHGDDSIVNHIVHIQEIVDDVGAFTEEYRDAVLTAHAVFDSLTSHDLAGVVLEYHYIQRLTWNRTAERLGYSAVHVKEIADDATLECYALMPCAWRDRIPKAEG